MSTMIWLISLCASQDGTIATSWGSRRSRCVDRLRSLITSQIFLIIDLVFRLRFKRLYATGARKVTSSSLVVAGRMKGVGTDQVCASAALAEAIGRTPSAGDANGILAKKP